MLLGSSYRQSSPRRDLGSARLFGVFFLARGAALWRGGRPVGRPPPRTRVASAGSASSPSPTTGPPHPSPSGASPGNTVGHGGGLVVPTRAVWQGHTDPKDGEGGGLGLGCAPLLSGREMGGEILYPDPKRGGRGLAGGPVRLPIHIGPSGLWGREPPVPVGWGFVGITSTLAIFSLHCARGSVVCPHTAPSWIWANRDNVRGKKSILPSIYIEIQAYGGSERERRPQESQAKFCSALSSTPPPLPLSP